MMFGFVYSVETSVLPGQIDTSHDRPLGAVGRTGADLSSASLLPTSKSWLLSLSKTPQGPLFTLRSVVHIFPEWILSSVIRIDDGIQFLDQFKCTRIRKMLSFYSTITCSITSL